MPAIEQDQLTDHAVQDMILRIRQEPGTNPEPALAIEQHNKMRADHKGYPREMYHDRLQPLLVLSSKEENEVVKHGYVRDYIHRTHPKFKFRRNMNPLFEPAGFIEERIVKDEQAETALEKQRVPASCGPWMDRVDAIEPLPEPSMVDPDIEIATLRGKIEGLNQRLAEAENKGKNKKQREDPE